MRRLLPLALVALAGLPAAAEPRRHDGFYARVGVGPGYAIATLDTGAGERDARGAAVNTELAAGWTVRRGLVIGGGTFPMVSPSPSWDSTEAGGLHVSATGPFAAYWFDDGGGLHVQGGILFAAGYVDGGDAREGEVGVGYGATAGVGFDRFVGRELGLGVLARVTAYRLYGVEDTVRVVTPALLVTATFH